VGEKESEPFRFTFNGFLKGAFQGSRVTSDAGVMLVREVDERLGLEAILAEHLLDSRHGLNTQFPLPDLLRQSVYSRLAGYEDLNDAARLSTDPMLRLILRIRGRSFSWETNSQSSQTIGWLSSACSQRRRTIESAATDARRWANNAPMGVTRDSNGGCTCACSDDPRYE
jgi:hypothetical protein